MKLAKTLALATLATATLATAASACPDLRVIASIVPYNGHNHILADVRNIGASNYMSNPGLQRLVLSVAGQPIHVIPFTNVTAGNGGVWHVPLPADDYARHVDVAFVFDPAVLTDGLASNNDCNSSNDRARVRLPG